MPQSRVMAAFISFMVIFTRNRGWSDAKHLALVAGGLGVYLWFGFVLDYSMHGTAALPGHVVVAAVILSLALLAGVRSVRAPQS